MPDAERFQDSISLARHTQAVVNETRCYAVPRGEALLAVAPDVGKGSGELSAAVGVVHRAEVVGGASRASRRQPEHSFLSLAFFPMIG
jgi:hypothetical protein